MSITDELRKYVNQEPVPKSRILIEARERFNAIADSIDAEHEQVVGFCKRLEDAAAKREDVELFGVEYMPVPLRISATPVDVNKVPIRIGDVIVLHEEEQ